MFKSFKSSVIVSFVGIFMISFGSYAYFGGMIICCIVLMFMFLIFLLNVCMNGFFGFFVGCLMVNLIGVFFVTFAFCFDVFIVID